MKISIIVAMDENNLIGCENKLPWHLPADLKFFKKTTLNKAVIMGANTYKSIVNDLKKPLPQRQNIVVSASLPADEKEVDVVRNLKDAINIAHNKDEIMIIGGSQIFKAFLPQTDRFYLTRIHHKFKGDTYFPAYDTNKWQEMKVQTNKKDDKNYYDYDFVTMDRIT